MLPVSQAVQASKATAVRSPGSTESAADQGFAALFAQGLNASGARAPEASAPADGEAQIQRASAHTTAPATDASRHPAGGPARQPAQTEQGASSAVATDPGSAAKGASDAPGTAGSRHSRAADATEAPPDPAAAAALQLLQLTQFNGTRDSAAVTPGSARVGHTGPRDTLGADAGKALPDGMAAAPDTAAGADAQAIWQSAAGAALAAAQGHGGAAAGNEGAVAAASTLGAGLSALLARQGSAGGLAVDLPLANTLAPAAAGAARSESGSDGSQLYAALLQAGAPPGTPDPAVAQATTLPLSPPFGDERWTAALGQQALFMARNQISTAQLTVHPPNLGPIQITLDLQHDQATATFVSPHDAVRQAIEASLPQLRDMFSAAGLNLGGAQVQADAGSSFGQAGGGAQAQSRRDDARSARASSAAGAIDSVASTGPSLPITRHGRGLLDTFA